MICPNCQNPKALKNGCRNGIQRYYCKLCKHNWSDSSRSVGQPPIYDRAMTGAEQVARFRAKKKENLTDPDSLS
jgi:transposase-like protein